MNVTHCEAHGSTESLLEALAAATAAAGAAAPLPSHIHPLLEDLGLEELQSIHDEVIAHPLLHDVAEGDALEIRIAFEKELGAAFPLLVQKLDGDSVTVWATANLQVGGLRNRLQCAIESDLRGKGIRRALDWRRVWSTHCLMIPTPSQPPETLSHGHFQRGKRLLDVEATMEECGVTPETVLAFSPYVVKEKGHKRARHYRYQRPSKRNTPSGVDDRVDEESHGVREDEAEREERHKNRSHSRRRDSTSRRDRDPRRDHRGEQEGHYEGFGDKKRSIRDPYGGRERSYHRDSRERGRERSVYRGSDEVGSHRKRVRDREEGHEKNKRRRRQVQESDSEREECVSEKDPRVTAEARTPSSHQRARVNDSCCGVRGSGWERRN